MIEKQSYGRNCQIRGDREKKMKFPEVAQIREFCKSRDAREKVTALSVIHEIIINLARLLLQF